MEIRMTANTTFGKISYGETFEWEGNVYMAVDARDVEISYAITEGVAVNLETGELRTLYYDEPVNIRKFVVLEET